MIKVRSYHINNIFVNTYKIFIETWMRSMTASSWELALPSAFSQVHLLLKDFRTELVKLLNCILLIHIFQLHPGMLSVSGKKVLHMDRYLLHCAEDNVGRKLSSY